MDYYNEYRKYKKYKRKYWQLKYNSIIKYGGWHDPRVNLNPCEYNANYTLKREPNCENNPNPNYNDPTTLDNIPENNGYCVGKSCQDKQSILDIYNRTNQQYFMDPLTRHRYTQDDLANASIIDNNYTEVDEEGQSQSRIIN
jgi:hypothetical protein